MGLAVISSQQNFISPCLVIKDNFQKGGNTSSDLKAVRAIMVVDLLNMINFFCYSD